MTREKIPATVGNLGVLDLMLQEQIAQAPRGAGPVKWCKRCSRYHPARERCNLAKTDTGRYVHR